MSGNNGGGGGGDSGGGGGIPSFDCDTVSIQTNISSPDPTVLATLSKGDFLNIELRTATGPLIAITAALNILGSVFTTRPAELINCINNGHRYHARILKIAGGDCQILITHI
jgi:hypothetical protein